MTIMPRVLAFTVGIVCTLSAPLPTVADDSQAAKSPFDSAAKSTAADARSGKSKGSVRLSNGPVQLSKGPVQLTKTPLSTTGAAQGPFSVGEGSPAQATKAPFSAKG